MRGGEPFTTGVGSGGVACGAMPALPCSAALDAVTYIGGRFVAPQDATVSLLDHGYLLGDGVFSTMRGYSGVCFRAERHLADLQRSAALFGIDLPSPPHAIAEVADEAARRTGAANAYVRVTLTRGAPGAQATLSVIARAMEVPTEEDYTRGASVVTVRPRRIPPSCLDGSVKSTSYAAQVLARREAQAKEASEGLMLAVDGALACGATSNLFIVTGDTLRTPSLESGCRAGVTRGAILELAPRLFAHVREERLEPSILAEADEAFFTSTRVECLPIAGVDGRPIGRRASVSFEHTRALRDAFVSLVGEETSR